MSTASEDPKKASERAMDMAKYEVVVAYACYLATEAQKELNRTKLYKSVWLADLINYIETGETITNDKILRLPRGPVNGKIQTLVRRMARANQIQERHILDVEYDSYVYSLVKKPDIDSYLKPHEVSSIATAVTRILPKSAAEISDWTHSYDAWQTKSNGQAIHPAEFLLGKDLEITAEDAEWARSQMG